MIRADNLTVLRAQQPILRKLNLQVSAGEALYILGDNGSGKTTLLQALAGLIHAQGGSITRQEKLIYLGHRAGVSATLSVRENLSIAATLYHRLSHSQLNAQLDHALAQVGLKHLSQRQARHLSAGQQRRCQLARLWLPTPPIWILDEPLTALDINAGKRLTQHCRHHLSQGGCLIVTSHQPFELDNYPIRHYELTSHAHH